MKTWLLNFLACDKINYRFSAYDIFTDEPYSGYIICDNVKYMIKRGILSAIPKRIYRDIARVKGYYEILPPAPWRSRESEFIKHMRIKHFKLLKKAFSLLPKDKPIDILVLGCGWGWEIWTIIKLLHIHENREIRIVGLDIARRPLKLARKIAIKNGYDFVDFVVGTVEYLPFKNQSFDIVMAIFGALDHSVEYKRIFSEVKRVLKKNGIFLFTVLNKFSLDWLIRVLFNPKLYLKTLKKSKEPFTRVTIPLKNGSSVRILTHYYNPLEIKKLLRINNLKISHQTSIFSILPLNFKKKTFSRVDRILSSIELLIADKPLVRNLGRYIGIIAVKKE